MKTSSQASFFFIATFVAYLLSTTSIPCQTQAGWTILEDMPTVAGAIDPVVLDGKVYVFGGKLDEIESSDTVWVLEPEVGWTFGGKMPDSLEAIVTEEWNGKIYLFGGHSHPDFVYRTEVMTYDPETQVFDTVSQLLDEKAWFTSAVLGGKIYIIGGDDYTDVVSTVDIFNPMDNTWESGPSLQTGRAGASADTLEEKIYVTGGGAYTSADAFNSVEIYDPAQPSLGWVTSSKTMLTRRGFHSCKNVGGKLFAVGGAVHVVNESFSNWVEYFDPETGEWVDVEPMNFARRELGAAVLGGYLYAFGGMTGPFGNATAIGKVEKYQVVNASHEASLFFDNKLACFPNPFSGQTTIGYQLDRMADVQLSVYDLFGRPVWTHSNENQMPGEHTVTFDGSALPKGFYCAVLELGGSHRFNARLVVQ